MLQLTSRSLLYYWLIICINMENFRLITRLTRRVPPVEQDLLTIPGYLSSPPVSVTRFVSTFSFGYCVVCSSLIYGFWLPLWYLQTIIIKHCLQNPTSVHSGKWLKQKMIPRMLLYFKLIIWIHMRNIQSKPYTPSLIYVDDTLISRQTVGGRLLEKVSS
jgi:hypothetical protein